MWKNVRTISWALGAVCVGLGGYFVGTARAAGIPATGTMAYSGLIHDAQGEPIDAAELAIVLSLWDDPVATDARNRRCEARTRPAVTNGRFQVVLPEACVAAVRASPELYVEIALRDEAPLPRTKIAAVPYAVEAERAVVATSATNATNSANATTLVGTVSQSLFRVSNSCATIAAGADDCSCNANEYAVSGGAWAGSGPGVLSESGNASDAAGVRNLRAWRVLCINSATGAIVRCVNPYALCLRVSP